VIEDYWSGRRRLCASAGLGRFAGAGADGRLRRTVVNALRVQFEFPYQDRLDQGPDRLERRKLAPPLLQYRDEAGFISGELRAARSVHISADRSTA